MASDAAGDSLHVGLNDQVVDETAALTGFTNTWDWSSLTMSNLTATLALSATDVYTLDLWMREDGLRVDRLLLSDDPDYIPAGTGPAESVQQVVTHTTPAALNSHVIHYTYDDLYRLTGAAYTGAITATYEYAYDPVGNMTAYAETFGITTTRVSRYFDAANQMQASFDYDEGTTSFYYDQKGNLVEIVPPGSSSAGRLRYGYDQRNLLITNTIYISDTGYVPVADFVYDGDSNRVRQVSYDIGSGTATTTTYTNDNTGLSQVLVADDGTTQTYNLLGLDLISQDDGAESRMLLSDGLGSGRIEMVGNAIETTTTYGPYGNLLVRTGPSGTVYGFTGEQHDATTGLVYLRARYYNPYLNQFQSRDPFAGYANLPASQNGYSYVHGNPINYTDPSGECIFFGIDTFICASIIGGAIIGGVTGFTYDVMVNQGKGGIANVFNGSNFFDGSVFDSNHYCDVDRLEALFSAGVSVPIGALSGYGLGLGTEVVAGSQLVGNTARAIYAHAYSGAYQFAQAYPLAASRMLAAARGGIYLLTGAETLSDISIYVRAMLGDPIAIAAVGEAMATYNPTLGVRTLRESEINNLLEGQSDSSLIVYRALTPTDRKDINEGWGLFGHSWPADDVSPRSHVAGAHHTLYISTGTRYNKVKEVYNSGNGIAIIDLSKVNEEIVDYRKGIPGYENDMHSNWAKTVGEMLVKDFIPPEAILGIIDD